MKFHANNKTRTRVRGRGKRRRGVKLSRRSQYFPNSIVLERLKPQSNVTFKVKTSLYEHGLGSSVSCLTANSAHLDISTMSWNRRTNTREAKSMTNISVKYVKQHYTRVVLLSRVLLYHTTAKNSVHSCK